MLAVMLVVASALLRPPASRADETSTAKPAAPGKLPQRVHARRKTARISRRLAKARAKRAKVRAKRRLAAVRMRERVVFRHELVSYAKKLIGAPYSYGGSSPRGFDCSGFVRYVYSHFGISLPHSSFADIVRGRSVNRSNLLPGDLVFFDGNGHVGIYVGHGEFIHAPHTGTVVRISSMSGWYASRFDGARRIH